MCTAVKHTVWLSLLLLSCSTQEPLANIRPEALVQSGKASSDSRAEERSVAIGKTGLMWEQEAGSAQKFDLYFVPDKNNLNSARKMGSRSAVSGRSQSVVLMPQEIQAAQESAPVGNDFCFYVIAVSNGSASDPSDVACLLTSDEQAK